MPSIVKSIRVGAALDARIKAVMADSKRDTRSPRRPMKEAEALGVALDIGIEGLERQTIGWQWRCGACFQAIESVRDGVVEWVEIDGDRSRDLRVAHSIAGGIHPTKACTFDARVEREKDGGVPEARALADVVGPDGFMLMTEIAARNWTDALVVQVAWKRLFVPGFEQVRPYIIEASMNQVLRSRHAASPLRRTEIEAIALWMAQSDDAHRRDEGRVALRILGKAPEGGGDIDDE